MFFPGSLVMDPLGDVLYAASTNADLSFGGATLLAFDLLRHERATTCFRRFGRDDGGDAECGVVSCGDSGAALGSSATVEQTEQKEAQTKHAVADYDRCYCERDIDDPNVINCEPQRFAIAEQTTKIGFFPGEMKILAEDPPNWPAAAPSQLLHRGIYLAVRGDPSVTFVDATRPLVLGRKVDGGTGLDLNCTTTPRASSEPTVRHAGGDSYQLKQCQLENRTQRTVDDVLVDENDPSLGTRARFEVPPEPMGLVIDQGCIESGFVHERGTFYGGVQNSNPVCYGVDKMGKQQTGTYYQYRVTSHLSSCQVAAFKVKGSAISPAPAELQDVSVALFSDSNGRKGAFALAPRRPGDLSQPWYVTSQLTAQLSSFRLASTAGPTVVPGLLLSLGGQFSTASQDVRDIVFEPGGERAFFTVYSPPAVAIMDTRLRNGTAGVPINQVTSITNVCPGPSRIVMSRVPRQNMGQTVLATRLYVSCYLSGQVAEIDGDTGELISTIQTGRGPLSMALNFGGAQNGIDPCADPYVSDGEAKRLGVICPTGANTLRPHPLGPSQPATGPRAYISNYLDNAIAVLDLDPRSPSYRRMIARIGLPSPKKVD